MKKSIYSSGYTLFLETLRKARQAAGITQEELAARIQQTQSFVSKYERGERRLDIVETMAICDAIGISFHGFVENFISTIKTKRKSSHY